MSEDRETSSRSLARSTQHQPLQSQGVSISIVATPKDKRRKRSSTSSNGTATDTKPSSPRPRSENFKKLTTESDAGSSRTAQRSTPSPKNMSSVNYTKTGRVSKAKKGLKVHDCDCGRSYTRAEHLRRHQRNHAQEDGMICKYPSCGKTFFRSDLLQRHEERHIELGGTLSRHPSVSSSEHSAHPSPMTVPASLSTVPTHTLSSVSYPPQTVMSPQPEPSTLSRYNPTQFRTRQPFRTPSVAPAKISNHFFQSSSTFKTPPNGNKIIQNMAYLPRHSISGTVPVDGVATDGAWVPESFAPSPYSCSSGYASPAPGPEYGHIYATPPYGAGMVRTRASSNASFIEQNWAQASQSPTSSISVPFSWATDEKNLIASTFPYTSVSYSAANIPMHASIGAVAHYPQYDPQNLVQMDNEESVQLFPGEQYGMSQIARAYPFEQWLNSYWRLFHPTFPIVHRFTFAHLETSPMLYAAMATIGAYYSNDSDNARELHDRCVKLLVRRQDLNMIGCDRICDLQAIFLVEVFALNFARRCAKSLSARFVVMFNQLIGLRSADPSVITDTLLRDSTGDDSIQDRWLQWVRLSLRHRLLVSCYLLETRHHPMLADDRKSPSTQIFVDDLHFPSHETLWEAQDARQWWTNAQEYSMMPSCIAQATLGRIAGCYDAFQSSVLIAALYHPSSYAISHLRPSIEHLLYDHPMTRQQFGIAKLVQLVPIPALLAVSGESWMLGTKVTSQEEFGAYKIELQSWIARLWPGAVGDYSHPAVEALQTAVGILTTSVHAQERCKLNFGNDLGLFYATLVLWAATAAASGRLLGSGFLPRQVRPSRTSVATVAPAMAPAYLSSHPSPFSSGSQFSEPRQAALSVSSDRRPSIPHAEIIANAFHFLSTAVDDITSFNVLTCQAGCKSLLLWMKMRLRDSHLDDQSSLDSGRTTSEYNNGEFINAAIGQIERMLSHGWEGWGI